MCSAKLFINAGKENEQQKDHAFLFLLEEEIASTKGKSHEVD